jgi:hypothetical protein
MVNTLLCVPAPLRKIYFVLDILDFVIRICFRRKASSVRNPKDCGVFLTRHLVLP